MTAVSALSPVSPSGVESGLWEPRDEPRSAHHTVDGAVRTEGIAHARTSRAVERFLSVLRLKSERKNVMLSRVLMFL